MSCEFLWMDIIVPQRHRLLIWTNNFLISYSVLHFSITLFWHLHVMFRRTRNDPCNYYSVLSHYRVRKRCGESVPGIFFSLVDNFVWTNTGNKNQCGHLLQHVSCQLAFTWKTNSGFHYHVVRRIEPILFTINLLTHIWLLNHRKGRHYT